MSGLSYFSQDFLTFTLPGIITFLCQRQPIDLSLVKSLLASDSTPSCVWEIVEADLRQAIEASSPADLEVKDYMRKKLNAASLPHQLNQSTLLLSMVNGVQIIQNLYADVQTAGARHACECFLDGTQDLLLSSLLVTMEDAVFDSFKDVVLPHRLQSSTSPQHLDMLADLVALCRARGFSIAASRLDAIRNYAFRERVDTWQ